jgi:hypothetical protein
MDGSVRQLLKFPVYSDNYSLSIAINKIDKF